MPHHHYHYYYAISSLYHHVMPFSWSTRQVPDRYPTGTRHPITLLWEVPRLYPDRYPTVPRQVPDFPIGLLWKVPWQVPRQYPDRYPTVPRQVPVKDPSVMTHPYILSIANLWPYMEVNVLTFKNIAKSSCLIGRARGRYVTWRDMENYMS